jgi:hypothetical protein
MGISSGKMGINQRKSQAPRVRPDKAGFSIFE